MADPSQPVLDRYNQTVTITEDCKRRITPQPGLQERHKSSQPVSSAGDDVRWHSFQSETNANGTSNKGFPPTMDVTTFQQTSAMRRFPPTKPSKNAFSDSMISSLTPPRYVLSNDEPTVLRDTSLRLQDVKLSTVEAASEEEEQVEEGRSEHGQEENDEDDKATEQEKAKTETDEYNNIGMKDSVHRYAQVEDGGDEGAAEGSENHGQVRERGELTKRRVAANGYEGAWRNLNDGEIDDEEEKVVGGEDRTPGERRKRLLERSGVLFCSTPEERPDKRSKHDGGENLNGAATIDSDVRTTSRTTRRHASRVVTMGTGCATG